MSKIIGVQRVLCIQKIPSVCKSAWVNGTHTKKCKIPKRLCELDFKKNRTFLKGRSFISGEFIFGGKRIFLEAYSISRILSSIALYGQVSSIRPHFTRILTLKNLQRISETDLNQHPSIYRFFALLQTCRLQCARLNECHFGKKNCGLLLSTRLSKLPFFRSESQRKWVYKF